MCPYFRDGKPIPRVTEVISAGECGATAYIEKNGNRRTMTRTSHSVTLPGTLTHAKIEQFENKLMGKGSSGLHLENVDKKLFAKIYRLHKNSIKKNPENRTEYNDIMDKVNDCYANFLAFYADWPHVPLLVEQRMFSKLYGFGGTVDLVGLFDIKGYAEKDSPDPKNLPKKYYWKPCDHTGKCNCKVNQVVCVADWKTSSKKQNGHRLQMSAYFCALEELGYLDKFREKGYHICWHTMSILLGKHNLKKLKTPYRIFWYEPYIADFLAHWHAYQHAENVAANLDGKIGLKGRCMFCSYLLNCPSRILWNLNGEIEFPLSLSRKELARMVLALQNFSSESMKDLTAKIMAHLTDVKRSDNELNQYIPLVLDDFEKKLKIKIKEETP